MGLKAGSLITMADIAAALGPDNKIAKVIEILNKKNPLLEDLMFMEGNLPTGHRSTIRSGLPEVFWRRYNTGIASSKSRSVTVTDAVGMLEARGSVDKRLADLGGNAMAYRLREDAAFIEAMSQEFATTFFYGNTDTDPEQFMGLAPRFNDTTAENGENIFLGGGEGSTNTSIWLVCYGENMVQGIYPKGSTAGVNMQDLGEVDLLDSDGKKYRGYESLYTWDGGIVVSDWRYVARGANIDVSALKKDASSGADLIDMMTDMVESIPSLSGTRPVFYCNKTIRRFLKKQLRNKDNVYLSLETFTNATLRELAFDGIPVKRADALVDTEEAIS